MLSWQITPTFNDQRLSFNCFAIFFHKSYWKFPLIWYQNLENRLKFYKTVIYLKSEQNSNWLKYCSIIELLCCILPGWPELFGEEWNSDRLFENYCYILLQMSKVFKCFRRIWFWHWVEDSERHPGQSG